MVAQVGYLVAGRSRGLVALCAVCTVHVETRSMSFLVEPQNQGRRFVSGLASKPLRRFSPVWPQNRWLGFPGLGLKTCSSGLMIWASKSPRRFLGLGPQNQAGHGLSVAPKTDGGRMAQDMHQDLAACFTWKQVTLGFPSLASRQAEARRWVMHMAPSRRLRWDQVEDAGRCDGLCRTLLPLLCHFLCIRP
jgi:hypothetical protein